MAGFNPLTTSGELALLVAVWDASVSHSSWLDGLDDDLNEMDYMSVIRQNGLMRL
jgi:hypothetical protein